MSYDKPAPPLELGEGTVEVVEDLSTEELRALAQYAEELAEYREREQRLEEANDEADPFDEDESKGEGVPAKASKTVKEIDGNKYEYWQWREGDQIKSSYIGPVDPDK
jgi:hypothetical protein